MAKPTEVASWSTDPGTTLEPSAGEKAAGFQLGEKPRARWLNWMLNLSGRWQTYLRDLHSETEFLGQNYAWTGSHSHGDAVLSPGRLDAQTVAADTLRRRTPVAVDLVIPLESYRNFANGGWSAEAFGKQIVTLDGPSTARFSFRLPTGHQLVSIRAFTFLFPAATLTISLHRLRRSVDAPYDATRSDIDTATLTAEGAGDTTLDGDGYTADAALDVYQVDLTGSAGCTVRGLTVRVLPYGDLAALL